MLCVAGLTLRENIGDECDVGTDCDCWAASEGSLLHKRGAVEGLLRQKCLYRHVLDLAGVASL